MIILKLVKWGLVVGGIVALILVVDSQVPFVSVTDALINLVKGAV